MSFREHASGLLVPDELSREREVWTEAEWRTVDRAVKFLEGKKIRVFLGCAETDACKMAPMERWRRPDGGVALRCAHKERIISKYC